MELEARLEQRRLRSPLHRLSHRQVAVAGVVEAAVVEPEVLEAQVPDQVLDLVRALGPAVVLSRLQYNRLLCR